VSLLLGGAALLGGIALLVVVVLLLLAEPLAIPIFVVIVGFAWWLAGKRWLR
jgi:hypothetical protein